MSRRSLRIFVLISMLAGVPACALLGGYGTDRGRAADSALAAGDTARAIELLERHVRKRGATPERYAQLGRLYRSRGEITDRRLSQEILEDGLRRYPDATIIKFELAKTYYAQKFYPDAERLFTDVVRNEPDNCEARYFLAKNAFRKWKHIQVNTGLLLSALTGMERVVACDPDNGDAFFKYAFLVYSSGDPVEADSICAELRAHHPDMAKAVLLAGAVAFDFGRYDEAERLFGEALAMMPFHEQEAFHDIAWLIMNRERRELYAASEPHRKRELERTFWMERDPDATTKFNEIRAEHYYRKFLADERYTHNWPYIRGWDTERGRAMVKFGRPVAIGSTLEGESLSGRMEVWTYGFADTAFVLFFRDEFLNGNYIVPINYRYASYAQTLYLEKPMTTFDTPHADIPGELDVLAFRNERSAEVLVAARVDHDSLVAHTRLLKPSRFIARAAFFDEGWRSQGYEADTLDGVLAGDASPDGRWLYIVQRYDLPFERHHVAFALEDDLELTLAQLDANSSTIRFLSGSLMLSGILLHHAWPESDLPHYSIARRRGRLFFVNPGGHYQEGEKLHLYVEVYNLAVAATGSEYEVAYSIYEAERSGGVLKRLGRGLKRIMGFETPPEPVISQTIQRRAVGHEEGEEITIDIDALEPGKYILRIVVTDTATRQTATRERTFFKETSQIAGS